MKDNSWKGGCALLTGLAGVYLCFGISKYLNAPWSIRDTAQFLVLAVLFVVGVIK